MRENKFQADLIKDLKEIFPGCVVLKNDSSYLQGIPDLIVLFGKKWAALECKADYLASHQPNQEYYVNMLDNMSLATFVFPENRDFVLDELQRFFRARR